MIIITININVHIHLIILILINRQITMKSQMNEMLRAPIHTAYTFRFEICTVTAIISAVYVLLSLFQLKVLLGFAVFFISVFSIIYFYWKNLRSKGLINLVSPKVRDVLLKRSIFDLYRDQVYYPYITKIVGTFARGAISKPHPQKLQQMFDELPENVRNTIFTKGILHLAPQRIQKLVIQKDMEVLKQLQAIPQEKPQNLSRIHEVVPKDYGRVDRKWDKIQIYQAQQNKVHQNTVSRQVLLTINDKLHWRHILMLAGFVSVAIMQTKSKKFGKLLLYNGSFVGVVILAGLLVLKFKKPGKSNKQQKPIRVPK